jgi:type IV secretion system protein VirB10
MSAVRAAPGEERLHLRATWQGVTGARKRRVLALVALAAAVMTALVYGIATAGRASRQAAPVAQNLAPGGGGEWLSQISDQPRGRVQEPATATAQTPTTSAKKDFPPPAVPPTAGNPPALTGGPAAGAKPLTLEEQYRLEVEKKRREARLAALVAPPVVGMTASPGSAPPRAATLPEGASALDPSGLPRGGASLQATSDGNPGREDEAQNRQAEKAAFLKAAEARTPGYLDEARTAPLGQYEVKAGSIIPAVLLSGINSDLPGAVVAQVRETVYDYVSARHVLIPQGSRLVGRYDSQIAYGQERVLVVWERILFPDGSSLALKGMPGTDSVGQGGSADQVDNHYGRLLGGVILSSILGVGAQVAYGPRVNTADPSIGQLAMEGVAGNVNQVGQQITRKNLNLQPTLVIRPGYLFNVLVTRDLVLPVYARGGPQQ